MSQTLPVRAAGGGQPSETASHFSLEPFSEPVLSHLLSARKGLESQDGKKFSDEVAWLNYMASVSSNAMSGPVENDLKYPMSSYFISSSHNTYLSGHQLYGEASELAYTNVLKRGCRCLEIDVWDGESDSDTSSSDEDEEKSETKASRWGKVKARAARMRSRSRSASLAAGAPNGGQPPIPSNEQASGVPGQPDNVAPARQTEPSADGSNHLSPQPSPPLSMKGEPRVLHGYTLTQSVTFRSVCHAIRSSAFVSTDLPLIVSLEVHASLEQQDVMVEIMREVWSEYLVSLKSGTEICALPPPESLMGKILIKVKWTPDPGTGESNDPIEHVTSNSSDGTADSPPPSPGKRKKASKVLSKLSELGVYTRAYTFKHFSQPEAALPNHVFSLSENKVHSMQSDPSHGSALFNHNKNFLMRVFPKGTRINSSNVDPTFHWRMGAQMVALNWQKMDKGMMLNEGMFAGTGGWVLKPEGYRCTTASDRAQKSLQSRKRRVNLEIRVLAAQRLPLPIDKDISHAQKMKPYVKAQLHVDPPGSPSQGDEGGNSKDDLQSHGGEEKDSKFYKRRSATARTDCPDFSGELLSWYNLSDAIQELSFLRLKIMDDRSMGKDNMLAWACIRLDRLRPGYRFIHLFNSSGLPSPGALLVHVSKRVE
ncbi:hypothetical protein A1O7_06971 [Cladophialophora yegresii CBS 114405]|uniref:Phosphoinositide phospholipase C n=1 Tax=Cladophialophora yegresii CBS 114405 TaxID=1182544 RepID=W9VLN8_9EURO|nr:uncharacterized protein A1O7_06971 [Cladophialophora yegresii CBS 114405]EXJ56627.1 hypothetical protein A1O7_06971 [Cladophialophora yegresii CBS 114405]